MKKKSRSTVWSKLAVSEFFVSNVLNTKSLCYLLFIKKSNNTSILNINYINYNVYNFINILLMILDSLLDS